MHNDTPTIHFKIIAQLHQSLGTAKPRHPLLSIIRFKDVPAFALEQRVRLISDFYQITLKKDCACKTR